MFELLWKLWFSLNYRYCMSECYMAHNRGDGKAAAEFANRASHWEREYAMCGRKLV